MLFFSKPLFFRKSFEDHESKFGSKSKNDPFLYTRYLMEVESLSLGIAFTLIGTAVYFNASELIISSILLLEGVMIVIFATVLYFNNHLLRKLMALSRFGDEPRKVDRYHFITLFIIGISLIFFAYAFRPLDFYF